MPLSNAQRRVNEGTTPIYKATLTDEDGNPIALADIVAITLTLYDKRTGDIINAREQQGVKNTGGVTIHDTSGLLTWQMERADNVIVTESDEDEYEQHEALFEWVYDVHKHGNHVVLIEVKRLAKVS